MTFRRKLGLAGDMSAVLLALQATVSRRTGLRSDRPWPGVSTEHSWDLILTSVSCDVEHAKASAMHNYHAQSAGRERVAAMHSFGGRSCLSAARRGATASLLLTVIRIVCA